MGIVEGAVIDEEGPGLPGCRTPGRDCPAEEFEYWEPWGVAC